MATVATTLIHDLRWHGFGRGPFASPDASPYFQAKTIHASWPRSKGCSEPSELADLGVLSANPLKLDPITIKEIQVLETIKGGTSLYRNSSLTAVGRTTAAAPINEKDNGPVPPEQPQKPNNPAQQATLDWPLASRGF